MAAFDADYAAVVRRFGAVADLIGDRELPRSMRASTKRVDRVRRERRRN